MLKNIICDTAKIFQLLYVSMWSREDLCGFPLGILIWCAKVYHTGLQLTFRHEAVIFKAQT